VGFRWKDDTKRECVLKPVFVGVKELKDYLNKEKGYTQHKVTAGSYDPKSYPAGTVTLWTRQGVTKDDGRQLNGPDAHCSMTINKEGEQIEMGADRAQVFGAKASPQPLLPDTLQSATYVPQEIWLPPGGARLRPRLREELEGMSRGRKPKTGPGSTGGSDWNCHGFLRAAAEHYAVTPDRGAGLPAQITDKNARYLPLKDPPGIPFAVELEAGALHGRGLEFDVFLPDGFVDFTHEFVVEVGEDGSAEIYVFAGEANYYPDEAGPVVRVLPGQMVAVRGGRASAPAPFDAASLEPWWPEDSPTARSGPGISLGSVLAGGSCLVALAAASILVWRAAGRRRAVPAAAPPSRPGPARTPREGVTRGQPPHAPAGAWGMLEVTQGLAPPRAQRLDKAVFTIGRSSDSDLTLRDSLVSRRHVEIRFGGGRATVHDLNSTNGTFLNGRRVVEPCALRPGDVISVGQSKLTFAARSHPPQRTSTGQRPPRPSGQRSRVSLVLDRPSLLIGRGSSCDLVLVDSGVSRRHARVHYQDGLATVQDLDSSNGTFVNGKRITRPCRLAPGDVIRLGRTELVYRRGMVQG
jgi:pSer/pThr/pTyr-binding forkhead associated (FHA) protein